jgi:probable phosphomutase (TIGR03848 family)
MTTFLLIRHANNSWVGRALAGDTPGVHLNEEGAAQGLELVERLREVRIDALYSSPLERALETAQALASSRGLTVQSRARLTEVGLGEWTGREFANLDMDPRWRRFNSFRSSTRAPGGELMTEVQTRIVDEMEELRLSHPEGTVALFSHADVIRCAVAFYAGAPLDLMHRFEISPASVSIIRLAEWGAELHAVNDTGSLAR